MVLLAAALTGLFYLVFSLVCSFFVILLGLLLEGLYARWSVAAPRRRGTSLFQPLRDVIKLLRKETLAPMGANRAVFVSMPLLALAAVCLAATILTGNVLWQNGMIAPYRFVGDVLVVLLLLVAPIAAMIFGAACSNSPFAAVAASRGVRMLSCMIPMILVVVTALVLAGAAERRFTASLGRQVSKRAGRNSMLDHRRSRLGRPASPLRFSEMLILNGSGPGDNVSLMVGRACLRLRPVRAEIAARSEVLEAGAAAAKARLDDLEAACERMHLSGRKPTSEQDALLAAAQSNWDEAQARAVRVRRDARNADWLTGTPTRRVHHLSGARLALAARGGTFVRAASTVTRILCVLVAAVCGAALVGVSPFDFGENDRALAGGALAEYSGPLLAFWRLSRAGMMVVLPLFIGMVFMGGFRFGDPWGEWQTSLFQALVAALKFFVIVYALALLRRGGWQPRPAEAMRFFAGPAAILGFCALFFAIVLFWSGSR